MADDLELIRSLEQLGERVADERFARDLYRRSATGAGSGITTASPSR
jgi:hypothetical protein